MDFVEYQKNDTDWNRLVILLDGKAEFVVQYANCWVTYNGVTTSAEPGDFIVRMPNGEIKVLREVPPMP